MFIQIFRITFKENVNGEYNIITAEECNDKIPKTGQRWPNIFAECEGYRKIAGRKEDTQIKVSVNGYALKQLMKGNGLYAFDAEQAVRKTNEVYVANNGTPVSKDVWRSRDIRCIYHTVPKTPSNSVVEPELFDTPPAEVTTDNIPGTAINFQE